MSGTIPLPLEFSELDSKVQYVQRKNANEYSGSCPACGGVPHRNGELPDRFVMLINSRIGKPFGFCRKCDYKWWFDKNDSDYAIDPETLAELERQSKEHIAKMEMERRAKLAQFTTSELWRELNERMQEEQRLWWEKQGIPKEWQDYLRLGYMQDKPFEYNGEIMHSPAYTIPYFHFDWDFKTLQYRLVNPAAPNDKYRFESGLGTTYYMTTPSLPIKDNVIICEGAKKGIVVRVKANMGTEKMTVLAVPSKTDWRSNGIIEAVKDCGRVWIVFDPDCWDRPENAKGNWMPEPDKLAKIIGKSARIVELPVKVDDAFNMYGMDTDDWRETLRHARRI